MTRLPRWIAPLALALAGAIHLATAQWRYDDAPAHGYFFVALGLAQVIWAVAALRWPTSRLTFLGLALSGGALVLYALAHTVAVPFTSHTLRVEWADWAVIAAEGIALAAMLFALRNRGRLGLARLAAPALLLGAAVWGWGLLAAPRFPEYAHGHGGGAGFAAAPAVVDTYDWQLPAGFPPPYVPPDNPMTAEKVALGRFLFYDPRLSANGTQSCSSCHLQELAFTDGRATAIGSTGEAHPRNAQGLGNVAYNATLTWGNPTLTALERQILIPMFGEFPIELGVTGHEEEVLARLRGDTRYRDLFAVAFPGEAEPIDWGNIVKALASFNRTLISGNSPYDRYVYGGDQSALSPSAVRGMNLFLSEKLECHHCHGGYNFSGSTRERGTVFVETPFHNTGLYNLDGTGAYPRGNTGIHELTGRPEDMGRFRAPSLRNVALTAPYMHDGSVATLEEVIALYEAGGRQIAEGALAGDGRANPYKSGFVPGFTLTDQEREDMLAFLNALTDTQFTTDPRFADPFKEPTARGEPNGMVEQLLGVLVWVFGAAALGGVLSGRPRVAA